MTLDGENEDQLESPMPKPGAKEPELDSPPDLLLDETVTDHSASPHPDIESELPNPGREVTRSDEFAALGAPPVAPEITSPSPTATAQSPSINPVIDQTSQLAWESTSEFPSSGLAVPDTFSVAPHTTNAGPASAVGNSDKTSRLFTAAELRDYYANSQAQPSTAPGSLFYGSSGTPSASRRQSRWTQREFHLAGVTQKANGLRERKAMDCWNWQSQLPSARRTK